MIPIIPILAWTGGIAAGARIASGVIRGVGELVRGRPRSALVQVAGGLVSPLAMVCGELRDLGGDIYTAAMGRPAIAPILDPAVFATAARPRRSRRRRVQTEELVTASVNGEAVAEIER